MTEQEIIQGASAGEAGALRECYVSTREEVERVCALFLPGDGQLPSAVVGAYGRAFHLLGQGRRPEPPLKDWLGALASQECFSILLKLRRGYDEQTKSLEALAGSIPTLVEISSDPKERVNFMIRGDIDDIPERHRDVLAMSELEGLHLLALAKRLGGSWTAALDSLMQARQALAQRVKESFGL